MKDDRLRIVVDDAYVEALGRATYVFAILEWNAVWCCERMKQKNYIYEVVPERKTAGMIADDLVQLARRQSDPRLRIDCLNPAKEFARLVVVRNGIVHGKPGIAPAGEQRLFSNGKPWTPSMIHDAAGLQHTAQYPPL